jgi:hypothetical protein
MSIAKKKKERTQARKIFCSHMQRKHWNINVVQQISMELDGQARGKEHDYFLVEILFQKREQQQKSQLGATDNVSLFLHNENVKKVRRKGKEKKKKRREEMWSDTWSRVSTVAWSRLSSTPT